MSNITGIHHVALKASTPEEYERIIKFYSETLEIPVARKWATGIMFNTGAGIVEVFNDAEFSLPQGVIRHFALAVNDVDAVIDKVRAAGYEITVEPKDIVIPSEVPFPARIAFFLGPIGEEVELFMEK